MPWLPGQVVLIFTAATFLGLGTFSQQTCKCATVKKDNTASWDKKHNNHDRIVGGYDTKQNKPWVARVWNDVQNTLCGGNLINKRYVLTAAHCICVDDKGMQCDPNGEPKYNVKAHFSVYLGVNKMNVDNDNLGLKGDKKYQYGVEWTTAYIPMEKQHDIGLLRLDRDAEFAKNFLQPICLPSPDVSDIVSTQDFQAGRGLQVYVSGWGKLFSECITNQLGPVKGMKCRKQYKYLNIEYTGCARTRPPVAKDEDCKAFKKNMKEDYPKKPGDSIKLVIGGTTKTCYKMTAHNGWCKTVSQGSPQASAPDTQWGWCEKYCKQRRGTKAKEKAMMATRLQETKLDVLPIEHCEWLTSAAKTVKYKFYRDWEICAGQKKTFHNVTTYIKKGDNYKQTDSKRDMMDLKGSNGSQYPYDYYVSGTDSCNGDSGGGLYAWVNEKPILLGIVSRGFGSGNMNGCAERNFPGIYSRVSEFLYWINKHTKDGNC